MAEKVTTMKLKVDLDCEKCYKKVKKLLAKYPQIRDQKFDKKENMVMILVVCCSPEGIRDKLCCKGGGFIKSIEILEPPKPTPPVEPKKPKGPNSNPPPNPPVKLPNPPVLYPPVPPLVEALVRDCCGPCSEGMLGGPCMNGHTGALVCYDGYYGRHVYDSYGEGRPYYSVRRCGQYYYFNEENVSGCTIL